jgi:hypothetical protein
MLAKLDRFVTVVGAVAAVMCAGCVAYLLWTLGLSNFYLPNTPVGYIFVVSLGVMIVCGITAVGVNFVQRRTPPRE